MSLIYVLIIIAFTLVEKVKGQCSSFNYVIQPPIPIDCKPFSNDPEPEWRLETQCSVESSDVNDFEIHWIQRTASGTVEDLGSQNFANTGSRLDSFFGDQLTGATFDESMLGQYWCEVYINDQPTGAYSDGFTILRPEEYDSQLGVCSETRRDVNVNICRDSPPSPPPNPSTSEPLPLPTQSTSEPVVHIISRITVLPASSTTTVNMIPAVTTLTNLPDWPSATAETIASNIVIVESSTAGVPFAYSLSVSTTLVTSTDITSTATHSTTLPSNSLAAPNDPTITSPPGNHITKTGSKSSTISHHISSINGITTASTPSIGQSNIVPEERLNEDNMDYLLLTAIALIVILSIIIVLLLVIACLMKCGRRKPAAQVQITRGNRNRNFLRLSSIRSSRAELLGHHSVDVVEAPPENPFKTEYVSSPPDVCNGNCHEYFTIDENTLPKKPTNTRRANHFNVSNLPQIKPPSIIRMKSPSPMPPVITFIEESPPTFILDHATNPLPHLHTIKPPTSSNGTTSTPHTTVQQTGNVTSKQNGTLINESPDNDDSESNRHTSSGSRVGSKVEKISNTDIKESGHQLENWDYQWNPMYMKIPVGLRVINTL